MKNSAQNQTNKSQTKHLRAAMTNGGPSLLMIPIQPPVSGVEHGALNIAAWKAGNCLRFADPAGAPTLTIFALFLFWLLTWFGPRPVLALGPIWLFAYFGAWSVLALGPLWLSVHFGPRPILVPGQFWPLVCFGPWLAVVLVRAWGRFYIWSALQTIGTITYGQPKVHLEPKWILEHHGGHLAQLGANLCQHEPTYDAILPNLTLGAVLDVLIMTS